MMRNDCNYPPICENNAQSDCAKGRLDVEREENSLETREKFTSKGARVTVAYRLL